MTIVGQASSRRRLVLQYGARNVPVVEGAPVVVGRHGRADLVIERPSVSRRHARFVVFGGVLFVEDLESRNGVFVNGERIHARALLAPAVSATRP